MIRYLIIAMITMAILIVGYEKMEQTILVLEPIEVIATKQLELVQYNGNQYYKVINNSSLGDISITIQEDAIIFTQDRLKLVVHDNQPFIYREGYIMDSMEQSPIIIENKGYLCPQFYESFLLDERQDVPSLYYHSKFFVQEIEKALYGNSEFAQRVRDEIFLSAAMNIDIPNIDEERVFKTDILSQEASNIREDLTRLGYESEEKYTYQEYLVIAGMQSIDEVFSLEMIEAYSNIYPTLPSDFHHWSLKQWNQWQQQYDLQEKYQKLSQQEQQFIVENKIALVDAIFIKQAIQYHSFMDYEVSKLKEILKECYRLKLTNAGVEIINEWL